MSKFFIIITIITVGFLFAFIPCSYSKQQPLTVAIRQTPPIGSPIYIQVIKEEQVLELYAEVDDKYQLFNTYPICKFSGGLGPKYTEGDFKSPEGFYQIQAHHLKPNSQYHQAINIGYPNDYDQAHGYSGKYLMIHGDCVSVGCYAMTNQYISEIYRHVKNAFDHGQAVINISIYPFRMTEDNIQRHRYSRYLAFWKELQPGYQYFQHHQQPPEVNVVNGRYVIASAPSSKRQNSSAKLLAFTKAE